MTGTATTKVAAGDVINGVQILSVDPLGRRCAVACGCGATHVWSVDALIANQVACRGGAAARPNQIAPPGRATQGAEMTNEPDYSLTIIQNNDGFVVCEGGTEISRTFRTKRRLRRGPNIIGAGQPRCCVCGSAESRSDDPWDSYSVDRYGPDWMHTSCMKKFVCWTENEMPAASGPQRVPDMTVLDENWQKHTERHDPPPAWRRLVKVWRKYFFGSLGGGANENGRSSCERAPANCGWCCHRATKFGSIYRIGASKANLIHNKAEGPHRASDTGLVLWINRLEEARPA